MNTIIKKSAITILSLAAILSMALPTAASAKSIRSMMDFNFNGMDVKTNFNMPWGWFGNNTAAQSARMAYTNAVNQANKTYHDALKTARTNLNTALKSAENNFSQIMSAYTTYMNALLSAYTQKNTAVEAAIQAYITALSNAQNNQAPTANNQSVSLNENSSVAITLSGSSPKNASLTYSVATSPSHGTLSGTVPNLTYTPTTNYNGTDSFTFTVNDGTQTSTAATITITVNGVNQPPVANNQSIIVTQNTSKAITLTGSDPENSTLTYTLLSSPVHGTLSGTVPNLTYMPATNFTGTDSFTFKVSDGILDSLIATVSMSVQ